MISSTSLSLLRFNIKLSKFVSATPFNWAVSSSNGPRIECSNSISKTILAYTLFPTCILYIIYGVIFDLTQSSKLSSDVLGDVCFRMVYILSFTVGVICMCNLWAYQSSFEVFVNSYTKYFFHIQETYVPKNKFKDIKNPYEIIIKLMSLAHVGFPSMQLLHCAVFPESKLYWGWMTKDLWTWMKITLELVHYVFLGLHMLRFFTVMMFHVLIYFIYIVVCLQILDQCSLGGSKVRKFLTRSLIRTKGNSLRIYNVLYLLSQLGNDCISRILYPVQYLTGFVTICCGVSLISFGNRLHWYMIVILALGMFFVTIGWIVMIHAAGHLFKKNKAWVTSWKKMSSVHKRKTSSDERRNQYLRKYGMSLRPAYVSVSGFYKMSLEKVLKFMNFLMWGTLKALILFRNIA